MVLFLCIDTFYPSRPWPGHMAGEIGRTQDAPMKHDSGHERKRDKILRTVGATLIPLSHCLTANSVIEKADSRYHKFVTSFICRLRKKPLQ
ncbi:hypothetical protein, partial [uncultured Phascolarctobacterium sp.]|uniref:hypothetical protein n=1 Tax=uncultured Phascolarctobacterium sp. TaxID=512296 RepID=UPI0025E3343F